MEFADPKNDLAFKKIFGDENHKNILISFLNSVLDFKGNRTIVDVTLVNPEQVPKIEEMKFTVLDMHVINKNGERFIIEMQKRDNFDFTKRSLYYTSKAYVQQLKKKESYDTLKKVYFIGLLNFNMFDNKNYISRHLILNKETLKNEIKDFEFTFIELNKFKKDLDQLSDTLDRWVYFLKNAQKLDMIPKEYENIEEFKEAFTIATQYNWTTKEMQVYDWVQKKEMDATAEKYTAKRRIEEAEKKGIEKGIEKGKEDEKINLAKNLLDILDDETIAIKTGLDILIVANLRETD
ncbi:MAG: Rpn family recombination-promoting nuclease/putative transposase [Campylobacterota bacterium]|nr:Rpn family recombination-promoting nuclease/putative transposase [Campylobacterota bacterium]